MKINLSELRDVTKKAIISYGYTPREAEIVMKVLLYAQLRDNNQGIVKLIGNGIPKREDGQLPTIVKETPVSALVDGNKTHAIIVMDQLADLAIEKAKKIGVGIAGNFNTKESTGALGYYVNKVAEAGLIGLAFAAAPFQTTAPHGSTEALFCTNPLAYGIPTETDPILLDMSTSKMAYYGLIEAKTAGKQIPEGVGYDENGNPTTDPAAIMGGALKTIAGRKGSGLAMVVQILAGAFVGADSFDDDSVNAGNLVIAIDPNIFVPSAEFQSRVSAIGKKVKSARKHETIKEILLPGERGNNLTKSRLESGEIEIEDNLYKQLKIVAGV
ncbi:MAG: Ldh family oxidoreductase [Weeksellaceae bacterium]